LLPLPIKGQIRHYKGHAKLSFADYSHGPTCKPFSKRRSKADISHAFLNGEWTVFSWVADRALICSELTIVLY
jgi:hypothetical protein